MKKQKKQETPPADYPDRLVGRVDEMIGPDHPDYPDDLRRLVELANKKDEPPKRRKLKTDR